MYDGIGCLIVVILNLIIQCGIFEEGNEVARVYLSLMAVYSYIIWVNAVS